MLQWMASPLFLLYSFSFFIISLLRHLIIGLRTLLRTIIANYIGESLSVDCSNSLLQWWHPSVCRTSHNPCPYTTGRQKPTLIKYPPTRTFHHPELWQVHAALHHGFMLWSSLTEKVRVLSCILKNLPKFDSLFNHMSEFYFSSTFLKKIWQILWSEIGEVWLKFLSNFIVICGRLII